MVRINLLPWREARRQERQRQFMMTLALGFILSITVLYVAVFFADEKQDKQNIRNTLLQREISSLDQKIHDIRTLEQERERLIARMDVIQHLQLSRPQAVKVFDALVKILPEGIYLDKVERKGDDLILNGIAQSNARISVFMQKIEDHPEFEEPKLQVIQRTPTTNNAIRKFTLLVRSAKPVSVDSEGMQ